MQVVELAAYEALCAGGLRQQAHQLVGGGGGDARGAGGYAESLAEQRDGAQHGDVFTELPVDGRLAAAQLGIVHARQVVEVERGGMHQLQRARQVQRGRIVAPGLQVTQRQQQQQRADALAGSQRAAAHGVAD